MTALKVGDRVKMSAAGKERWTNNPNNPHDGVGTITRMDSLWTQVRWDNSMVNSYKEGQLELAEFAVGARVRLTAEGKRLYAKQANGTEGVVMGKLSGTGWQNVKWDGGHRNDYQLKDLEHVTEAVKIETPKPTKEKDMTGKEKTYIDRDGDVLEVDTKTAREYVYFTTGEGADGIDEGQIVRMDPEQVKKIRKQLTKWLDSNGYRG